MEDEVGWGGTGREGCLQIARMIVDKYHSCPTKWRTIGPSQGEEIEVWSQLKFWELISLLKLARRPQLPAHPGHPGLHGAHHRHHLSLRLLHSLQVATGLMMACKVQSKHWGCLGTPILSLEYLQKFCAKGADGSEYICNMHWNHWFFLLFFVHLRSRKPLSLFFFLFLPYDQCNHWAFSLFFSPPNLRSMTCRQMEYAATVERIREEA